MNKELIPDTILAEIIITPGIKKHEIYSPYFSFSFEVGIRQGMKREFEKNLRAILYSYKEVNKESIQIEDIVDFESIKELEDRLKGPGLILANEMTISNVNGPSYFPKDYKVKFFGNPYSAIANFHTIALRVPKKLLKIEHGCAG